MGLETGRIWTKITEAAHSARKPSHVAVSYFGSYGHELLPLFPGSKIVVDASTHNVKKGIVNPNSLMELLSTGTRIFSLKNLHAKAFAFDRFVFVGSTNASSLSERVLTEAAYSSSRRADLRQVRHFVANCCVNELNNYDLRRLATIYRPPVFSTSEELERSYVANPAETLLMELTGESRNTQVQPPLPVWERFFRLETALISQPPLFLANEEHLSAGYFRKAVVKHHHTYTIEIPEIGTVRPAIIKIKRIGRRHFSFYIRRAGSSEYAIWLHRLQSTPNPYYTSGRLWAII